MQLVTDITLIQQVSRTKHWKGDAKKNIFFLKVQKREPPDLLIDIPAFFSHANTLEGAIR